MMRTKGFTLVELLVVVAIIAILAAMVVPRVANWIDRSRMARAAGEIRNADLSITKMLTDVGSRKSIASMFKKVDDMTFSEAIENFLMNTAGNSEAAEIMYKDVSKIMYELLRRGKEARFDNLPFNVELLDDVRGSLGSSYMDLGPDPWGTPYIFYPVLTTVTVPLLSRVNTLDKYLPMGFRCHRGEEYFYDLAQKNDEDMILRGNPPWDNRDGYPAARDLPVYIFSFGGDGLSNQGLRLNATNLVDDKTDAVTYVIPEGDMDGGGDDINNWDSQSGWSDFY